jgi:hypothetical protein
MPPSRQLPPHPEHLPEHAAGLRVRLTAVDEPAAGDLLAAHQPVYSAVPIFFAARAVRH